MSTVTDMKAAATKRREASKPTRKPTKRTSARRLNLWEKRLANRVVIGLAAVNLTILGVSLEHLASGIIHISNSHVWAGWAMAVAIDIGMVASEVATIALGFAVPTAAVYAQRYVIATITLSMALNTLGFWPDNPNPVGVLLAIVLGCGIPVGVWHLTRVAGELWMKANYKKDKR